MSDIFPKWTNRLPLLVIAGGAAMATVVVAGVWYYFTPKYTRVGYQPIQPVANSHAIHVGQVGMDCRYCHSAVERSWFSSLPPASLCQNCHQQILKESEKLALVRQSAATGKPIGWIQIHKVPDYVYFNHAVHVNRGVSCLECHGAIHRMEEVHHAQPLSMAFCLDCHRDPAPRLRPLDTITDLDWAWSDDPKLAAELARTKGGEFMRDWNVEILTHCSACHR